MINLVEKYDKHFTRAFEMLPGIMAWGLILSPAIGGIFFPEAIAYMILIFIAFWFFKSFKSAFYSIIGYYILKEWEEVVWKERWKENKNGNKLDWDEVVHVIIIPNYNESVGKLSETLDAFSAQKQGVKKKMYMFLGMEERAVGAQDRANELIKKYKNEFALLTATYHPDGIAGEVRGKASNETWAAKEAKKYLEKKGIDLNRATVTSCDADAQFHPLYFAALTYFFATNEERYLRFWQSPIFWYNNLHRVPFPIKMMGVIGHAIHLSDLQEPSKLIFNYSCYSLSFNLLYRVGYWHTDIIPEDWHLFLQTFFETSGEVQVDPLYLPTYIDAPEANTWFGSLKNRYEQCKRHAWGATDIPYAIKESIRHKEIPILKRIMRVYKMFETHVIWSTNWFILALGALLPVVVNPAFSRTSLGYHLPKMAESILQLCLIALLVMIIIDFILRPPKARPKNVFHYIKEIVQWATLPLVTLPLSVLPGLHAQTMLLFGKRLEYKVTEKV